MHRKYITQEQKEEIVALILENKSRLTAYIRNQFENISDCDLEDCFQNLFLRTYEKFPSYHRSPNKTGWLFRALKNIMHEFCREKKKQNERFSSLSSLVESKEDYQEENDIIFDILTQHCSEEDIACRLLSHLNEKEEKLYRLRYIEGLTTYEIADKLSLPCGTVRARLSDLKKKITKMVYDEDWIEILSKSFDHSDQKPHI